MLNQAYRDNNNRSTSEREINMTKRIRAKHKIDRRLRVNLWGRPKSHLTPESTARALMARGKKNNQTSDCSFKPSKKLKGYYGNISEKQFRRYYKEADQRQGDTSENLIGILEQRLDAVVYRMKFVPTVFSSRQFINHGHILVNGKRVNIPSYKVKDGDVIEVKNKSRDLPLVLEAAGSPERDVPDYIEVDHGKMRGSYLRQPGLADVLYPAQMEPNLVIEYYSR